MYGSSMLRSRKALHVLLCSIVSKVFAEVNGCDPKVAGRTQRLSVIQGQSEYLYFESVWPILEGELWA